MQQVDVSNHRIGLRLLDMAAWQGQRLLLPDQLDHRLLALDVVLDWCVAGEHPLSSRVAGIVCLGASCRVAVFVDDGSVTAGPFARSVSARRGLAVQGAG